MSLDSLVDLIDRYAIKVGTASISWVSFIWNGLFILFFFSIKTLVLFAIRKHSDNLNAKRMSVAYIIGYEILCWLFSSIVSLSGICFVGNANNIIFNYFIAPVVGFLAHYWFDAKVLTKVSPDFRNILTKASEKSKGKDSSDSSSKSGNSVVVNVGGAVSVESNKVDSSIESLSDADIESLSKHITESDIEKDSEVVLMHAINDLKDNQSVLSREMKKNAVMMQDQSDSLSAITHSLMMDKKFELERDINDCLVQGYVKPEQNKKITSNYLSYTKLHGNGEIKELYEKHYLKLQIHEDRRRKYAGQGNSMYEGIGNRSEDSYGPYPPSDVY